MLKYFLLWFPMLFLAILNGAGREWYKQFTTEATARQLSTVSLLVLFALYVWAVLKIYQPRSAAEAIYIGVMWLILTLTFEFGFGLYRGNSWSQLFAEYNLLAGRL